MLTKRFCIPALLTMMLLFALSGAASAQVASEALFPDTTQGFFEISSIDAFKAQWRKTRLGALLKDPIMEAARKEVQQQIDAKWVNRLGLSLDDLQSLPSGSISGGMIAVPGANPGFVLVISVKDKANETLDFLQRIGKKLEERGVKRATTPIENVTATYFTFEKSAVNPKGGIAIYLLARDTLVITDQQHLAGMMVKRLNGEQNASLREKPAYKAVLERVARNPMNTTTPLVKWYIEPLDFTAAMRMISVDKEPQKKGLVQVDVYELLAAHGFKDILGIGGTLDLATDNYQLVYRIKAYSPQPRTGAAINMLSFENNSDFAPPKWMPENAARFTVLYINPQTIFTNIGPIFDDIVDEQGVWNAVIRAFLEDKYRKPVDIQKELVDHLGNRLVFMTRFEKPIVPESSRFVAALTLKPGSDAIVAQAFEKLFSGGQDAKKIERNGVTYWQSLPANEAKAAPASSSRATRVRRTTSGTASASNAAQTPNSQDGKIARELFFDKGALAVANGYIFIGNNIEDLYSILESENRTTPVDAGDYATLAQTLAKMDAGQGEHFLQILARSGELVMPTYELARQGKVPEARTILGVIMRAIMTPKDGQLAGEKIEFDRSTLPPFEQIKSYFGTAGTVGIVEEDGWLIEGAQLP